jgi:hypothetical protein
MTNLTGLDDRTAPVEDLAPAEVQALAREAWRHSGGRMTGAELAARYGRSERWGRQQIAAARNTPAAGADAVRAGASIAARTATGLAIAGTTAVKSGTASAGPHAVNGTTGTTTSGRPAARRQAPAPPERAAAQAARKRGHPLEAVAVPLPLLAVTVGAVVIVTAVCAVVSYCHIRDLARLAGMGSLAGWLPLGVDGLVVAASCSLIVDRRLGRPGHPLAWAGAALGLAGSLAANVLAVDPDLVSLRAIRWALAGYSPAALAVSGHLLFRMLGDR